MPGTMTNSSVHTVVQSQDLQHLLDALRNRGYQVLGPTLQDGAIVYDEIEEVDDLPAGWTDEQEGGTYRLKRRDDGALFGYTLSPQSWKRFLHPPKQQLWSATQDGNNSNVVFVADVKPTPKYAFLGVRSCELHAIGIQNTVFTQGPFVDPRFKQLHDNSFRIAVNCGQAGNTCFCVSMKTGPRVTEGFDLALTEIIESERHVFLVEVGTPLGAEMMEEVPHEIASEHDLHTSHEITDQTARHMGRTMSTANLKEFLYANVNHPQWDEVANRCLACCNCTTVCPTCFCSTTEDTTDLTGQHSERWQRWDSCFTIDFSYIHGGSVRSTVRGRYRQWMTHKLAAWIDQFGTSGCVGCGRCITWCPVGIDITTEVRTMRESDDANADISALNMV